MLRLRNLAVKLQAATCNPAPLRHGLPQHVAAAAAAAAAAFNDLGPDAEPDDASECSESDSQGGYSEAEDDMWEQQAGASASPATAAGTAAGDPTAPDVGPLPQQSGSVQVGALCPFVYLCVDQGGCMHALHPLPTVRAMMEGNQTGQSPCQPTGMNYRIRCGSWLPCLSFCTSTTGSQPPSQLTSVVLLSMQAHVQVWRDNPPWTATPDALQLLQGIESHAGSYDELCWEGGRILHDMSLKCLLTLLPDNELISDIVNSRMQQLNMRTAALLQQGVGVPQLLCLASDFMLKLVPDLRSTSGEGCVHTDSSYRSAVEYLRRHRALRSVMPYLTGGSVLGCQQLLVPCFIPGASYRASTRLDPNRPGILIGHWVLLLADMRKRHIEVIDPLNVRHSTLADLVSDSVTHPGWWAAETV